MTYLFKNTTRLLFGALLLYSSLLLSKDVSGTTFLFCLKPSEPTLAIQRSNNSYEIDNQNLNQVLHDIGVVYLEEWIHSATDRDRHGDIYLNRIYRAFIDEKDDVDNVMNSLRALYPVLYVENENIHHLHYTPNDSSYGQQCSMSSVKADKAWDLWDIPEGIVPDVLLEKYHHCSLLYRLTLPMIFS